MWDLQTIKALNTETINNIAEYRKNRAGDLHDYILDTLHFMTTSNLSEEIKAQYYREAVRNLNSLYNLAIK